MTGKEALEDIKNIQHYREVKNWIIATPLQNTREYKAINKDLEELTKYKRAFEILKKNIVPNQDVESLIDIMVWREDNKEEYELLEELMKDESR